MMRQDEPCMVRPEHHEQAVADIERSILATRSFDGSTLIVTVGQRQRDPDESTQHNAIVSVLREVASTAAEHDMTVVPELLNERVDHPGYFLRTTDQGSQIVDAVNSSNVKLLFDVYHQQITEGDVIQRFRRYADQIGHVHIADNPGRQQPGISELDYERILAAIADTGYDGYVSCEGHIDGDPHKILREIRTLTNAARGQ